MHDKKQVTEAVNNVLNDHFEHKRQKAMSLHPRFGALMTHIHELVAAGGKRARPYLTVHTYESYGGRQFEDICKVGAGIELLHTAMLMHDDIIDRDYVRYGVKNIAGRYREIYQQQGGNDADVKHMADSAALLAGDVNIAASFQMILTSNFSAEQKIAAQELLAEACFRVTGGELIDTDAVFYPEEETHAVTVMEVKTAHYSFVTPLLIGATLAGADDQEKVKLENLGMKLGVAFQLTDDLLGMYGDSAITGKSVIGDIREGKRTVLYQEALQRSDTQQREYLQKFYGNSAITEDQATKVRQLFVNTGAKLAVESEIQSYADTALSIVASLKISNEARVIFEGFITSMIKRDH